MDHEYPLVDDEESGGGDDDHRFNQKRGHHYINEQQPIATFKYRSKVHFQ